MALSIREADGSKIGFQRPVYQQDRSEFSLGALDQSNVAARVVYALRRVGELGYEDFTVRLLKRHVTRESDIFQVFDGDEGSRVGWLIPIAALESVEHGMAEDQYFCNYAFAAYHVLLAGGVSPVREPDANADGVYRISDFYDDEATAFVVSLKAIEKLGFEDFKVEDYYACLFRAGWSVSTEPGDLSFSSRVAILSGGKKVNVRRIAPALRQENYVRDLLEKPLLRSSEPIVEFFLLYQVFELLMQYVYELRYVGIVKEYLLAPKPTLTLVKNLFDKIKESSTDKSRMIALCGGQHFPSGLEYGGLRDACNKFLSKMGLDDANDIPSLVYPIRNKLVHELRAVSADALGVLPEVNDELKDLVAQMMVRFVAC